METIMKYCPDCDMEFIDSVEHCTDCGKALVDKDAYLATQAEREAETERAAAERRAAQEALLKQAEEEALRNASAPAPAVYVKRADRYEDLKSSASAFLLVGAIMAVLAVLSFGSALHLPFTLPGNIMLKLMFIVLALGSFGIYLKTAAAAKAIQGQIAEEQTATAQLTQWFLDNYSAAQIDETILREQGALRPEVLALRRMELIQDCFITHYDLADQSYVDALAEDIYGKLYPEEDEGAPLSVTAPDEEEYADGTIVNETLEDAPPSETSQPDPTDVGSCATDEAGPDTSLSDPDSSGAEEPSNAEVDADYSPKNTENKNSDENAEQKAANSDSETDYQADGTKEVKTEETEKLIETTDTSEVKDTEN